MNKSNLEGFLGNEGIVGALLNRIEVGKLANTLLFSGPQGIGKKTLAALVAKRLFCPISCGTCSSCQMLAKGIHPDFLLAVSQGQVKLELAGQVKAFLGTAPNTAPYKVAVVENCQNLTVEAGNSLLKILEEPPETSVCVLTADSTANVLPTLVSRSQVYTLSPLPPRVVENVLRQKGIGEKQGRFLVGFSEGILGRAVNLAEKQDFWQMRLHLAQEMPALLAREKEPLSFADNWQEQPEIVLALLEFWLRDMVLLQANPSYEPVNSDYRENLAQCTAACSREKSIALLDCCFLARERLQARCNPSLVFGCLALKMWEV